jgi:hypothetical protein
VTAQAGRNLSPADRARWLTLAIRSADEARLPDDPAFRAALTSFLEWVSRSPAGSLADAPRWGWSPGGQPDPSEQPAGDSPPSITLPAPDETVGFEAHVRPLFRERDRTSMRFAFDLWSSADVQNHATGILERLRNGTMPCDGAWPQAWTEVFKRWADSGFQP